MGSYLYPDEKDRFFVGSYSDKTTVVFQLYTEPSVGGPKSLISTYRTGTHTCRPWDPQSADIHTYLFIGGQGGELPKQ